MNIRFEVYTDGTYSKSNPGVVAGAYVVLRDGKPIMAQRVISKNSMYTSMNNVGGELIAASQALAGIVCIINNFDISKDDKVDVNIFYDCKAVEEFSPLGKGHWKTDKKGPKFYKASIDYFMKRCPNMNLRYTWVPGHSGVRWNEMVDEMSRGYFRQECSEIRLSDFKVR